MRNVYINQAETIFENFWDCGDSYPTHRKYSCLTKYKIKRDDCARVRNAWCGVSVNIAGSDSDGVKRVVLSRDCDLDIRGFDILRFFGNIQKEMRFIINCVIDGEKRTVCDTFGLDDTGEIDGRISGEKLTFLELIFEYEGIAGAGAMLHWLGLSNSIKQKEMESIESPYDSNWEGCFAYKPEIRPEYGIYFDSEGLERIREKVKKEPYKSHMENLRNQADEDMKITPEKVIGKFMGIMDRRWRRDRDMTLPDIIKPMGRLAFVGIVDGNAEYLKMACRMALSVCHCEYWCESIMGVFPGATWHHRSFSEELICVECCKVLEWAGGLLTWHGKNIIYDSIIMKGLPRILADIKTMDYIWRMNQGVVFTSSLVVTLLLLKNRYPRYEIDLEYAEKSLYEMWENFCDPDGGVPEGPAYWNYTVSNLLVPTWLLARNAGRPVKEYARASIKKSAEYALCLLSDKGDKCTMIPVNDTKTDTGFAPLVSAFYYQVTEDPRWNASLKQSVGVVDKIAELIIFGSEIDEETKIELKEEYINLMFSGHQSLRRKDKDIGFVRLFIQNSPIIFSHTHHDKGSFVLEAGDKALLIDRGICGYSEPYGAIIRLPEQHNLLVPVREGFPYHQNVSDVPCSGTTLEASFDGKEFKYSVDLTETWQENVFKKNIRSFYSDEAKSFIITDDIECADATVLKFCLNSYGEITEENGEYIIDCDGIKVKVTPINWTPQKVFKGEFGRDARNLPVNQLGLFTGAICECALKTKIEVVK